MNRYAGPFLQGIHPPIASPKDMETSPHAVGFGMKFAPTAARKKNASAIPKKILPMSYSLKASPFTPAGAYGYMVERIARGA